MHSIAAEFQPEELFSEPHLLTGDIDDKTFGTTFKHPLHDQFLWEKFLDQ